MVLHRVRDIEDDERERLLRASRLVSQLTLGSPYKSLLNAHDRWTEAYGRAVAATQQGGDDRAESVMSDDLPAGVSGFLFAFRAFTDHTARWVIEEFGRDSAEHQAFVEETHNVYDSNLAYRVGCNLRNTAQHRSGSVLNINATSSLTSDGDVESGLRVTMAPDAVDEHWQARARNEVHQMTGPIFIAPLLVGVVAGSERVHARLVLLSERVVRPAAETLLDTLREAVRETDERAGAVLVERLLERQVPQLKLAVLRYDLAELYLKNVGQSGQLLAAA